MSALETSLMAGPNLLPGKAEFPLDAWYVAAFSRELKNGEILPRMICGEPMAFYRTPDGAPAALFDQCPHRGLPLSKGKALKNGNLMCGYHGFEFGSDGQCKLVPSQSAKPSALRVKSYPVVELWKWIWVWPGDPSKADLNLIPDHNETLRLSVPGWKSFDLYDFHVDCNYLLISENAMDQQHIYFVHASSVVDPNTRTDNAKDFLDQRSIKQQGNVIRQVCNIGMTNRWPMDDWVKVLEGDQRYRRITSECHLPSIFRVEQVFSEREDLHDPVILNAVGAVTPASVNKTYYFSAYSMNSESPRIADPDVVAINTSVYHEDFEVYHAIQASIDDMGIDDCPNISVRADEFSIRIRRELEKMIKSERGNLTHQQCHTGVSNMGKLVTPLESLL